MKCVKIIIKGNVQGVFFRSNTRTLALQLGIKGYVKNLPNGSVEIVAEGSKDSLDKLMNFCKKGPKNAVVEEVKIQEIPSNNFKTFEIRY